MKAGLYPKLALEGILKNKRTYFPYVLTCVGMVAMYYIIGFLRYSYAVANLPGSETVSLILSFGSWVIAFFSLILLFYTNSFLIRCRKKEFGLYNILGMGKASIGKILFFETLIVAVFSLLAGLGIGIALSKLAELGLLNIMHGSVNYAFTLSPKVLKMTALIFGVIFFLLFLSSIWQIRFTGAIALLRSRDMGEKPPKANWIFGVLGALILAVAYFLAVTIRDPLTALALFFAAVLMVIVATYLLFISGSVFFCRILQKNKKYYYKTNHFISVSSMVFRMKRNGAGLASVCILSTMVLVMLSSTSSLYFGSESVIHSRYPRDINMESHMVSTEALSDENIHALYDEILSVVKKHNVTPKNFYHYRSVLIAGLIEGNRVETDVSKLNNFDTDTLSNICQFYFIPLSDYNRIMGTNETLADGEAMIYAFRRAYREDTLCFNDGQSFKIKKQLDKFIKDTDPEALTASITVIVPDLAKSVKELDTLADYNGDKMTEAVWTFEFDTGVQPEQQVQLYKELRETLRTSEMYEKYHMTSLQCESLELERNSFYSLYGGLFYLGITLSIVFVFAAVLIIYYKQISEGYEDQARFDIMKKVGLTRREIKKSINSQLLTVFFLPLVFSACHLLFAFPIIRKLLTLFGLDNVGVFATATVVSFAIFALFYTAVYRITSNAYYHIVSDTK